MKPFRKLRKSRKFHLQSSKFILQYLTAKSPTFEFLQSTFSFQWKKSSFKNRSEWFFRWTDAKLIFIKLSNFDTRHLRFNSCWILLTLKVTSEVPSPSTIHNYPIKNFIDCIFRPRGRAAAKKASDKTKSYLDDMSNLNKKKRRLRYVNIIGQDFIFLSMKLLVR